MWMEFDQFYEKYFSTNEQAESDQSQMDSTIATTPISMASTNRPQSNDMELANDAYTSYFDPRFPKSLSIVLLVVGIIGNSLCLFIFSRKNMRKNSTFVYLACLAIVDLVVLTLGLGDIILIVYLNFNMRNQSMFMCRFITFLIYAFTHLSSFILASVSIDRAVATNFITFSKTYCRPQTVYKVVSFNVGLTILINFHSMFFFGYTSSFRDGTTSNEENGTNTDYVSLHNRTTNKYFVQVICESKKDSTYDRFLDPYFKWIDLLAYAIIPFIIMLICTFLIVRVLFRSNRRLNLR